MESKHPSESIQICAHFLVDQRIPWVSGVLLTMFLTAHIHYIALGNIAMASTTSRL